MKMKKAKLFFVFFVWVTLFLMLENPAFQVLNMVSSSSEVIATAPTSLGGISIQGSWIVSQNTQSVQAFNSTSGKEVSAFEVTNSWVNFGSVFLLILPWVIFVYSEQHNLKLRIHNKSAIEKRSEKPKK